MDRDDVRFELSSATLVGRMHAALRRNRQDAMASWTSGSRAIGVVADGCGSGTASELGAAVTARVMASRVRARLTRGERPRDAVSEAFADVVEALGSIAERASPPDQRADFVAEHLLSTVIAFVIDEKECVLLASGDGLTRIDGSTIVFDQGNAPEYPAYRLLGREVTPPIVRVFERATEVAIATDGFDEASLERALGARRSRLERALRIEQQRGSFEDDATIVIARRQSS
jgi:hypothetical protein